MIVLLPASATATILYSQTVTSSLVPAMGAGHNILSVCIPVSSAGYAGEVAFWPNSNAKVQAYAIYISTSTISDCSVRGSAETFQSSAVITPNQANNTVDPTPSVYLAGATYILVEVSDGGTPGTMTDPSQGTTGLPTTALYNNNAYIVVTDQYGTAYPPDGVTFLSPATQTYVGNPVEFSGIFDNRNAFNQIEFHLVNTSIGISIDTAPYSLPAQSLVGEPWIFQKYLPFQGNYELKARLLNTVTGSTTPYTSTIYFGLGTTTVVSAGAPGTPQEVACETFDFGCYIKAAFVWLFYPTASSLEQFSQLSIEDHAPFSYIADVPTVWNDLFNSSTTASTTISVSFPWVGNATATITLLSASTIAAVPYVDLLKDIQGWAIGIGVLYFLYRKVMRVHDTTSHV